MNSLLVHTQLFAMFASTLFGGPGQQGEIVGQPWVGMKPIRETVEQMMDREYAIPPDRRFPKIPHVSDAERPEFPRAINPFAPAVSQWPPLPPAMKGKEGSGRHGGGPYSPQTIGTSFLGVQISEAPFAPPDSQCSVGPTEIIVCTNGRIKSFSKTGAAGTLNTSLDSFFSGVISAGTSDPQVRYDRTSGRWFVIAIDVAASNNRIVVAVSNNATINGATVWSKYFFNNASPPPRR